MKINKNFLGLLSAELAWKMVNVKTNYQDSYLGETLVLIKGQDL